MANIVEIKKKDLTRALQNLKEVLVDEPSAIERDSALLRFELATELAWKALKHKLDKEYGEYCTVPAITYRTAGKVGLLALHQVEDALLMNTDRNRLVHDYNENYAIELYGRVKAGYYPLLTTILKIL